MATLNSILASQTQPADDSDSVLSLQKLLSRDSGAPAEPTAPEVPVAPELALPAVPAASIAAAPSPAPAVPAAAPVPAAPVGLTPGQTPIPTPNVAANRSADRKGLQAIDTTAAKMPILLLSSPDQAAALSDKMKAAVVQVPEAQQAQFAASIAKIDKAIDVAQSANAADKQSTHWYELAELLGHAISQVGAGMYGLKYGIDATSGIKFSPTDWEARREAMDRQLDKRTGLLERQRAGVEKLQAGAEARATSLTKAQQEAVLKAAIADQSQWNELLKAGAAQEGANARTAATIEGESSRSAASIKAASDRQAAQIEANRNLKLQEASSQSARDAVNNQARKELEQLRLTAQANKPATSLNLPQKAAESQLRAALTDKQNEAKKLENAIAQFDKADLLEDDDQKQKAYEAAFLAAKDVKGTAQAKTAGTVAPNWFTSFFFSAKPSFKDAAPAKEVLQKQLDLVKGQIQQGQAKLGTGENPLSGAAAPAAPAASGSPIGTKIKGPDGQVHTKAIAGPDSDKSTWQ